MQYGSVSFRITSSCSSQVAGTLNKSMAHKEKDKDPHLFLKTSLIVFKMSLLFVLLRPERAQVLVSQTVNRIFVGFRLEPTNLR
jgi:hypothetical protein